MADDLDYGSSGFHAARRSTRKGPAPNSSAPAGPEARRDRLFEYRGFHRASCLVEADEEPPHPASADAVDVALTIALLLGSSPVDEVQWMRKTVIDGSNTSGFQR